MTTTVRISNRTHERVVALAATTGHRMARVLEDAVAAYEQHLFWTRFTQSYEQLADDAVAWDEIEHERRGESSALPDGLD